MLAQSVKLTAEELREAQYNNNLLTITQLRKNRTGILTACARMARDVSLMTGYLALMSTVDLIDQAISLVEAKLADFRDPEGNAPGGASWSP